MNLTFFLNSLFPEQILANHTAAIELKGLVDGLPLFHKYTYSIDEATELAMRWDQKNNADVYFGVALRQIKNARGMAGFKSNVHSTYALWVDVDKTEKTYETFLGPASALIDSGNGFHAYWFLEKPLVGIQLIEERLDELTRAIEAADPSGKNCNRILRFPGTHNHKDKQKRKPVHFIDQVPVSNGLPPVWSLNDYSAINVSTIQTILLPGENVSDQPVRINSEQPKITAAYNETDLTIITSILPNARKDLRDEFLTEKPRGTRSEIDFHVMAWLLERGASEKLVRAFFDLYPVGSKVRERGQTYFDHTLERVRNRIHVSGAETLEKPDTAISPFKALPLTGENFNSLLTSPADDVGHAQCVLKLYPNTFIHSPELGWLCNFKTHWANDSGRAVRFVEQAVEETLLQRRTAAVSGERVNQNLKKIISASWATSNRVESVVKRLRARTTYPLSDFNNDPFELNVQNGVLDLRKGILRPRTKDDRFTYCLSVAYDPNVRSNLWESTTRENLNNDDLWEFLQQAVGYSLTGDTREECLFYIYGPTRSGKGTFLEPLNVLLGDLARSISIDVLTQSDKASRQKHEMADLHSARLVVVGESTKYRRLNATQINAMTGGDEILCAFKYGQFFRYRPKYKLWIASNWPIPADPDDVAFWRRVRYVEFPVRKLSTYNTNLKIELKKPHHLQGILTWAVEGAVKYQQNNLLHLQKMPQIIQDTLDKQRTEQDSVHMWLCENCLVHPQAFVGTEFEAVQTNFTLSEDTEVVFVTPNATLYDNYKQFCIQNDFTPKNRRHLFYSLHAKGFKINYRGRYTLKTDPVLKTRVCTRGLKLQIATRAVTIQNASFIQG